MFASDQSIHKSPRGPVSEELTSRGHATKRIAVTKEVWESLSMLRRPGETFSDLIEALIETEKKARLMRDMIRIAEEEEFVELNF
ncbi:MAG: hypothetical protein MUO26_14700 [Methanotrichaceae archaeon]|nr:hypothetical protein [Methanotrichaceae archaeon]